MRRMRLFLGTVCQKKVTYVILLVSYCNSKMLRMSRGYSAECWTLSITCISGIGS